MSYIYQKEEGSMAKNYVYKSKLYEVLKAKGMRLSGDAIDAVDDMVEDAIKKAAERAKANGRKTVKGCDF
jgi:histone H3/H4